MLTFVIVCCAAAGSSALTLYSGFGLGTLLLPVFALFFPVPAAVVLTAIVHFLNNLFKAALLGKHADRQVVLRFGIPALAGAALGAITLDFLAQAPALATYSLFGQEHSIVPVKLAIALLMFVFAAMEIAPALKKLSFPPSVLPAGGFASGFFGGLSGHQGALRSAFLSRAGLSKESFLGSGILIALLIDAARLTVYARQFRAIDFGAQGPLLAAAVLSAFLGAWISARCLHKITLQSIQILVAALLFLIATGLALGLI